MSHIDYNKRLMKTLKLTLAVLIITAAGAFAEGNNPQQMVRVLSVKRDIFYFKIGRSFIGGKLEVYSENGELIFSDKLTSHKAIVDFYFQDAGLYEIKIKKNDQEVSFGYTKSTPKPDGDVASENQQVSMFQEG